MRLRAPFVFLLGALLTACGSEPERAATGAAAGELNDGAIHLSAEQVRASGVQSIDVVEQDVAPAIVAIGRVRARAGGEAEVFSPFSGRLVGDGLPRIGDPVARAQRIAEVEQQFTAADKLQVSATAIALQTSVEQAQQEVELKRKERDRAQQLFDGGAIPEKQLQTADFDLKQADARLEGARRSKAQYDGAISTSNSEPRRAPILSPISGTIIAADATLGQQVEPSKSLLTIADLGTVWVEAAVHERDLPETRAARDADISTPGSPGRSFTGHLVTLGNVVDPQNRTVPITFSVDNREGVFKIGMFVQARIATGPSVKALMIPASAVLSDGVGSYVYVESPPGAYRRKAVSIGERRDDLVVVMSGLEQRQRVVTVGAQLLRSESLKGDRPVEDDEKR